MTRAGRKANRPNPGSKRKPAASLQKRRVAPPNPHLVVLEIGERYEQVEISPKERASGVLAGVAKVMTKAGPARGRVFRRSSGKPVYAYSIYSQDPTKVVREDVSGRQTVGRFVRGRFHPVKH